jgi:2-polyprenyl-3-methyl-5-hydroxy-6-metoxy-1,4-benzoquinol methylase
MVASPAAPNRYWAAVDPAADNNAHAFALELVGHGKRVLELGPAAGHVTRVLINRGCDVVAIEADPEAALSLENVAECIVGDLCDPSVIVKVAEDGDFDVVLAGDVLEHLPDPLAVLRACRQVLLPGGYVVISLPNIAHADIVLSLFAGRFNYNETGLLDRTHLRFFTSDTIDELLLQAGFQMLDLRRVLRPVFETELGLDPAEFPRDVVEQALAAPEAETYQFVLRATPHSGDVEIAGLAVRALTSEEALRREHIARVAAEAEAASLRVALVEQDRSIAQLRGELAAGREHIDAIYATKSMRALAPLRAVYSKLRQPR